MSHALEESPISDTKMDISDTTTSRNSPAGSPDSENKQSQEQKQSYNEYTCIQSSTNLYSSTDIETKTELTEDTPKRSNIILTEKINATEKTPLTALNQEDSLDNRKNIQYIDNSMMFTSATALNNTKSALTLANSHPLMSPPPLSKSETAVDSELDENNKQYPYQRNLAFSYPDVVPACEPLRLSAPSYHSISPHHIKGRTNTMASTVTQFATETESDFLNSGDESEPDLSQYHATVTPHFESVVLIPNHTKELGSEPLQLPVVTQQRKIPITSDLLSDDVSSFDSISNQSFDGDVDENNLISASVSSSMFDDTGFNQANNVGNIDDIASPMSIPLDGAAGIATLPQYSASDEARDSRNWHKIILPDGKVREIDMRVIEPYKRVLSHGGYLTCGGHNAIVVFSACHLPDRSRTDYHYVMDNLFLYVIKTLDQLITDDYVLIYLHGGSNRSNVPPFPWLKKCYQLLDRRLRKSLKNLFLVHPTFWLKSVVWMARPFISSKFWKKLIYVRTLDELYKLVPLERAAVPEKVKKYDVKYT